MPSEKTPSYLSCELCLVWKCIWLGLSSDSYRYGINFMNLAERFVSGSEVNPLNE